MTVLRTIKAKITNKLARDGGSFRDPSGYVFVEGERVFRTVNECALEDYIKSRDSAAVASLVDSGLLISSKEIGLSTITDEEPNARYLLEHPKLPFISYPYEWPFSALKDAALAHLDVHLALLEDNLTLVDASALGRPIDRVSLQVVDDVGVAAPDAAVLQLVCGRPHTEHVGHETSAELTL